MNYPKNLILLPESHPLLRKKSSALISFEGLKDLSELMFEKMYDSSGIGLAAPQVGISIRMFVIHIRRPDGDFKRVCINPEYIEAHGAASILESCLSVEEKDLRIPRSAIIKVRYFTEYGVLMEEILDGLESICFQHELDHLDGILISDY